MEEQLLVTVEQSVELFLYEGILKQNEIPYIIKHRNLDGYMKIITGSLSHSVPAEIYVGELDYERAVELTRVIADEENQAPDNKDNPNYKKRNIFAWIIVSMFILMILIALLTGAFKG
ncbi:MAG TPA: DUF2007 domain-containing protein [Clostridia bacterium]|nr:DUF2007 domain-containing protein [Clostridia bacterium]HPQ45736.1 DUF2007 domain-containing protein [Clostridia bacterium]